MTGPLHTAGYDRDGGGERDRWAIGAWVTDLQDAVRAEGRAERAEAQRRYLHSDRLHLGVGVPELRRIVRGALAARTAAQGRLERADLLAAVDMLWRSEPATYEFLLAAVELLTSEQRVLEPGDIDRVEALLRGCQTWALVDPLAALVAGPLLERHPEADALLDRWAADADFWIRRAALLSHLVALRGGAGDFARFGRLADTMIDEREFFIRKAIGWVLRDTGRKRPELVAAWAHPRWGRLSTVTRREVLKVVAAPS